MSADARDRLDYLASTIPLLWPGLGGECEPRRVVLPSVRAPRLLVPTRPRRAIAAATLRYTAQQGVRDRLGGAIVAAGAVTGACALLPPVRVPGGVSSAEPSIDDHLSGALGSEVITTLALTRTRANRKPVLQVFDPRGRTVAFAKIGTDSLTCSLVDAEAATLRRLAAADLRHLSVPAVLHHGSWRDTRVLVLSALDVGFGGPGVGRRRQALLDEAMHDVSAVPPSPPEPRTGYLHATRTAALEARDRTGSDRISQWLAVSDEVCSSRDVDAVQLGRWHGDWTAWNCAARRGHLGVWDWERSEYGVPRGFDKLHYVLNRTVGPDRDQHRTAAPALITDAPRLLARWRLSPAQARTTAVLYVLHLALRYLRDGAPPASLGSRVEDWAYPTVRAALVPRTGART